MKARCISAGYSKSRTTSHPWNSAGRYRLNGRRRPEKSKCDFETGRKKEGCGVVFTKQAITIGDDRLVYYELYINEARFSGQPFKL
jgi:hypothetical protein